MTELISSMKNNAVRKEVFIPLLACFFSSILIVFLLYQVSDKINHNPNGFIRMFPPHMAMPKKIMDVKYNSYYIAGATADRIYLGNFTAPALLLTTNYSLSDSQQLKLKFQEKTKLFPGAIVTVDSSNIYLMEGRSPAVLWGKLSNLTLQRVRDTVGYFISSMPISPRTYVLKVFDRHLREAVLARKIVNTGPMLKSPAVLEKQIDGVFCTDGSMNYDPATSSLVYVYYYRNQFIRMDTSLNVLYRGKTIDTTSHAQIKVAQVASNSMVTLSSPPMVVNKKSCISGDNIFINSGLRANNEEKKAFENCSVIDVYNLKNGEYRFSFYLPNYEEKKISEFRVFNKTLVALYDHYLYTYQLNF